MTDRKPYRHRFPINIIQHALWLYHRFPLSERDVQELLHQRGIVVSIVVNGRTCVCWLIRHPPLELSVTPYGRYPAAFHSANELEPL